MTRRPSDALRGFLAAYDAPIKRLYLATRRAVLAAAPDANELIYDAYNALTTAYSFTPALGEAFCHVAAYRGYVNLGFNRGSGLADPGRLLVGTGARIRHVRIDTAKDLERLAILRLLHAAVEQGRHLAGDAPGGGKAIVKAEYAHKRR